MKKQKRFVEIAYSNGDGKYLEIKGEYTNAENELIYQVDEINNDKEAQEYFDAVNECENKDENGNACFDCEAPTGSPCGSTKDEK